MSTKALRHLIAVAKNYGATVATEEALAEVEAIEKACASMRSAEVFIPDGLGNIRDLDVLFNIAKESSKS